MDQRLKDQLRKQGSSSERLSLLEQIKQQKDLLDQYATASANEKKTLRLKMAELEDQLRKLRDNLAEIEIENQSYETLV